MTDFEKKMTEEHYYCKLLDSRTIEFKDRDSCLRYFKSHKGEVEPYGCGYWRWDQARRFILFDSMDDDCKRTLKEDGYKSGQFLYL